MTYSVFIGTLNPTHFTSLQWSVKTVNVSVISLNLLAFNGGNFPGLKCIWNGSSPWKCPERRPLNLLFDAVGNFCLKSYIHSLVDVTGICNVSCVYSPLAYLLSVPDSICTGKYSLYSPRKCTLPDWRSLGNSWNSIVTKEWPRCLTLMVDWQEGHLLFTRLCQMCLGLCCGTRHGDETISCWNGADSWVGFHRPDVTCHHPMWALGAVK